MKSTKKSIKILALLLVAVLALPLIFACGEKEDVATTPADGEDAALADGADSPAEESAPSDTPQTEAPPTTEAPTEEDVPDSGTAQLLGQDFDTKGDWVGVYGSEGSVIAEENNELENLPAYATYEFEDDQFYTWWDSESGDPAHADDEELAASREASALFKTAEKTERIAACWYETYYFSLYLNVGDAPKKVTLYMNDFDSYSRSAEVTVKNKNGKAMKEEPAEKVFFDIDEYVGGCYISYLISGEVQFDFDCLGGNVTLSGIFFDPAP